MAIDADAALHDVVEAWDEVREGGFTGSTGANQGDYFSCFHVERDAVENGALGGRILEGDVVELDGLLKTAQGHCVGRFFHLLVAIQVFKDFLRGSESLLEDVV